MDNFENLSIVLPAKNEGGAIGDTLKVLKSLFPEAEIIVVDDGSSDDTGAIALSQGARVVSHPYSMGNGAAIKTGARAAGSEFLIFMDADGQHKPEDAVRLYEKLLEGYDMVVGSRQGLSSQAGFDRAIGNKIYNRLASYMVGKRVEDLTSGMRGFNRKKFLHFISLLPNKFSYPTTITMAFFRAGYRVAYIPIHTNERVGDSHVRIFRDGIRFFLIIIKVGMLYSPLRVFVPVSFVFFSLGLIRYSYTYITSHTFSNMSAMLFASSVLVFLIGLISEQIAMLIYMQVDKSGNSQDE